jgi:RNA polymerase sigma factor (TIGR02999 family)
MAEQIRSTQEEDITEILTAWREGSREALHLLLPVVYDELRRQAHRYLRRERQNHTLQTTALIHEAYLRLTEQRNVRFESRTHFFAVAANLMRQILVDYARERHRLKRGGKADNLPLDEAFLVIADESDIDLLALDEALTRLSEMDFQQARIVELRFFGGLSIEETADALAISPATVKRDWNVAKAWLKHELSR